jgi:hypothetical protein
MTRPPWAPEILLRVCCPRADRVFVLGELNAEFARRGCPAGWYWRQALRSVAPLLALGARRGDWEFGLFAVMLAAAGPTLCMEAGWSFILSHVPLKADAVRGVDFAAVSLAFTVLFSVGAGMICTVRGLFWAIPAAWVFSLLAQAAVHNSVPVWFGAATLGTVTGALLGGAWLRRWFEGGKVA